MGPSAPLAVGPTARLAGQAVAIFVALALVVASVGECRCLTSGTAADPCACCGSTGGPATGKTLRPNTSVNGCATGGGATFGESVTKLYSPPPAETVINVAQRHDGAVSLPVARLVGAPPLVRSSRQPILRI